MKKLQVVTAKLCHLFTWHPKYEIKIEAYKSECISSQLKVQNL